MTCVGGGGNAKDGGYLRAGSLNVNSIKAHVCEIRQFLKNVPFYHLFGVAESKLAPAIQDYLVHIDSYTFVEQYCKVGGSEVAWYARNTLKIKILKKPNTTGTENGETREC